MDIVGNRTLYSVLRSHASAQPDTPWLFYELEDGHVSRWTFSEFLASVHETVNFLRGLGVRTGDVINLHLANHPAYVQVILAASYMGAVVLPTSPASSPEELRYFLDHADAKVVITQQALLDCVESLSAGRTRSIVVVEDGYSESKYLCYERELKQQGGTVQDSEGGSDKVVQLLYTSGTTSRPKGVMLTNANFIYGSEVFRAATGLRDDDRHLIALPLYHSAAQCHALWPSLITGCSVAIMPRFSASRFFEQAGRHEATMTALFGAPLRMLLNQPSRAADKSHRLRNVTFAQNLTTEQYEDWHRRFRAPLQQLWGMTELCALPIMSPLDPERRLSAMGRPVLGYEVRIVDDSGQELPPNTAGQLIVRAERGRSVMKGYLKNEAATDKVLREIDGAMWMLSGDTAMYDEDGFFYFLDRSSDMIKRSGLNISTSEVESVIARLSEVADVCVCGLPDATRDELVAAVIVKRAETTLTTEQVRSYCAANLAPHKVPEKIHFCETLPRTSVGKLRKNVIRAHLLATLSTADTSE